MSREQVLIIVLIFFLSLNSFVLSIVLVSVDRLKKVIESKYPNFKNIEDGTNVFSKREKIS
jgi:hypothetical protein